MVFVPGTDGIPVWADRRCLLPVIADIARQSSVRYVGANPRRHLKTVIAGSPSEWPWTTQFLHLESWGLYPLGESWVPIKHNVAWAEAYLCTTWHLDLSSHLATIDIGWKLGWGCAPFLGGAGSPSNTKSPGPRPTCKPSFILIRPTVWLQYTNVTDRQTDRQDRTMVR